MRASCVPLRLAPCWQFWKTRTCVLPPQSGSTAHKPSSLAVKSSKRSDVRCCQAKRPSATTEQTASTDSAASSSTSRLPAGSFASWRRVAWLNIRFALLHWPSPAASTPRSWTRLARYDHGPLHSLPPTFQTLLPPFPGRARSPHSHRAPKVLSHHSTEHVRHDVPLRSGLQVSFRGS